MKVLPNVTLHGLAREASKGANSSGLPAATTGSIKASASRAGIRGSRRGATEVSAANAPVFPACARHRAEAQAADRNSTAASSHPPNKAAAQSLLAAAATSRSAEAAKRCSQ